MKLSSMKTKITGAIAILIAIGFTILVMVTMNYMESNITSVMLQEFIKEDSQIAEQAAILIESGADTARLQTFVEELVASNDYIAYAVVVDSDVSALAHSDTEKIGKSYADDTSYSVPAATQGEIMTSSFWADVQNAWTYDVMYPITVNGTLFGSMDIGIYNSTVDSIVAHIRNIQIIVAVCMILAICVLVAVFLNFQLKPLGQITEVCDAMGTGDFTSEIDEKLLGQTDEIGKIANSMYRMKNNLAGLIMKTDSNAQKLLSISDQLNTNAQNTQQIAGDIVSKSDVAVSGTQQQTELTDSNARMTEEITKGMENIAENMTNITTASTETVDEAKTGAEKLDRVVSQMSKIENNVNNIFVKIQELEKMSDSIQKVVQLIADIASQTNLLSLNASIEAARAGEQGKGFAVVADEVGSLADQSRSATEDISKIIGEIQNCIEECVHLMEEGTASVKEGMDLATGTQESFSDIMEKINQVSNEMLNASAITQEVTSETTNLYNNISEISNIAGTVAGNTAEVSSVAKEQEDMMLAVIENVKELSSLSSELKDSLTIFKINA